MTSEGIPAVMNVTPTGNNGSGCGWGGDWASWIILFLIFGLFGWGGMGMGMGGFGFGGGMMGGLGAYGTEAIIQRQLDTNAIVQKLDGITNGLCDGFYATNNAINGLGMNMMQGFNGQTIATMQAQNAIQSQLSGCCCDIERAIDGVRYDAAANTCAIQTSIANATRDITANADGNARAILDQMRATELQNLRDKLAEKDSTILSLRFAASQSAQNDFISANQQAQTAEILRQLGAGCPQPAFVVQPPQPVSFALNPSGQATFGGYGCNGQAYAC